MWWRTLMAMLCRQQRDYVLLWVLTLAKASLNQCWSFYIYPQSFSLNNQAEDEPHTDAGGLEYSVMLGLQGCVGETVFAMCELSCRAWWYRPRAWNQMTIVSHGSHWHTASLVPKFCVPPAVLISTSEPGPVPSKATMFKEVLQIEQITIPI